MGALRCPVVWNLAISSNLALPALAGGLCCVPSALNEKWQERSLPLQARPRKKGRAQHAAM